MILHLTNDFSGSTVYKGLVSELDHLSLSQFVYNPIRDLERMGKNWVEFKVLESEICYALILNNTTDRILYKKKINKIFRDLETKIDLSKVKCIHAHTWYSDGGVAYLISKKYRIPYIIAVRSTDLNVFQKYLLHERSFGKEILEFAQRIVVISASYKERLLKLPSLQPILSNIEHKLRVLPNGVDPYWLDQAFVKKSDQIMNTFNVLFIGKFTKSKNVESLQKAIIEINEKGNKPVHLHLIGGGGKRHQNVLGVVGNNSGCMTYHGKIYELSQLKQFYQDADIFAMPSKHETFGLVYIEALLQGLPVLYTANEGIDGFYEEKIGEKVSRGTAEEIAQKLQKMIEEYPSYTIPTEKIKENHDWSRIAKAYQKLYEEII